MVLHIAPGAALPLAHATKHALVTGATGTGKSTTAGALVERLSMAGVPVLAFDAKGDLESLGARIWCPFGKRGEHRPLDLAALGPDLIARALDLSPAQSGVVEIAVAYAEDRKTNVHCLDDLQAALRAALVDRETVAAEYGLLSPASAAAVSRAILPMRRAMGEAFGPNGPCAFEAAAAGGVTVYTAGALAHNPAAYAALVSGVLLRLYQDAAEAGAVARPGIAVLIDEAHLLFDGATPAIVRKLEQVARLVRSRGVMLIFATQSPADLPDAISAQLLTRIQHGLRAVTPGQMRAVKAAAESMPAERGRDLAAEILTLGVGEALVSVPDAAGRPGMARRVKISPGTIALHPDLRPVERVAEPEAAELTQDSNWQYELPPPPLSIWDHVARAFNLFLWPV